MLLQTTSYLLEVVRNGFVATLVSLVKVFQSSLMWCYGQDDHICYSETISEF